MNRKIIYPLFAAALLLLRFIFNYSYELIPGINGGYYPLQVRTLLENGHLGFSDMPLYFYLNAAIVKIISFFITIKSDLLIIQISKIIDSISLPRLIVPLYLIIRNFSKSRLPLYYEGAIVAFAMLSFSPLILTSDLQKNAFALPLMLFFIYFLMQFYSNKSKKYLILTLIIVFLTALTHFGVFLIALLFFIISLIVFYGKKSLLPVIVIALFSIILIYLFDPQRAERLFTLWHILFKKPAIFQGPLPPLDIFNYLFSYFLIALSMIYIFRNKKSTQTFTIKLLTVFSVLLFILSFPLLDVEFARRFNLFLFIPQIMIILFLFDFIKQKLKSALSLILILCSAAAVFFMTARIKPPTISQEAYQDLSHIEKYIANPQKTLIIARHGLEWWTAWRLHVKVGQDKALDRQTFTKYEKVFSLVQLKGINQIHPRQNSPFHEPYFPKDRKPLYLSPYFKLVALLPENLNFINPGKGL